MGWEVRPLFTDYGWINVPHTSNSCWSSFEAFFFSSFVMYASLYFRFVSRWSFMWFHDHIFLLRRTVSSRIHLYANFHLANDKQMTDWVFYTALTLSQTTKVRLFQTPSVCRWQFEFHENGRKSYKRVENTVGKGEIAHHEQFLRFPLCFQKTCTSDK